MQCWWYISSIGFGFYYCKTTFASTVELCPTKCFCIDMWYSDRGFAKFVLFFSIKMQPLTLYQYSLMIQDTCAASLRKEMKSVKCHRWRSRCSLCKDDVLVSRESGVLGEWVHPSPFVIQDGESSLAYGCRQSDFFLKIVGMRVWGEGIQYRPHVSVYRPGRQSQRINLFFMNKHLLLYMEAIILDQLLVRTSSISSRAPLLAQCV